MITVDHRLAPGAKPFHSGPSNMTTSPPIAPTHIRTGVRLMRIGQDTRALLPEFWKTLESELPAILDAFYDHVTREPNLAKLLGKEVPRLKTAQRSHWARLFDGRFDQSYMDGVRQIGMVHNKIGLEPRWYI